MKKLSIIVPMYKAKSYIKGCVSSLLNQNLDNYEIILIDDFSPDDTYEYATKLYGNNEKIKIIKQEKNNGPGFARNKGIDIAKGEYITFCDIDDYFIPNTLGEAYNIVKENDLDLFWTVGTRMLITKETKEDLNLYDKNLFLDLNPFKNHENYKDEPYDIKARFDKYMNREYSFSIWGKIYNKKMLDENNIRFCENMMGEDQVFLIESLMHAKKFASKLIYLNGYRVGNTSLSRTDDKLHLFIRSLECIIGTTNYLERRIDSSNVFKDIPEYKDKLISFHRYSTEYFYTLPLYKEIGSDIIKTSDEVDVVFKKYYGEKALEEKERLFLSYDNSKDNGKPFYNEMTYEKLSKLLKNNINK